MADYLIGREPRSSRYYYKEEIKKQTMREEKRSLIKYILEKAQNITEEQNIAYTMQIKRWHSPAKQLMASIFKKISEEIVKNPALLLNCPYNVNQEIDFTPLQSECFTGFCVVNEWITSIYSFLQTNFKYVDINIEKILKLQESLNNFYEMMVDFYLAEGSEEKEENFENEIKNIVYTTLSAKYSNNNDLQVYVVTNKSIDNFTQTPLEVYFNGSPCLSFLNALHFLEKFPSEFKCERMKTKDKNFIKFKVFYNDDKEKIFKIFLNMRLQRVFVKAQCVSPFHFFKCMEERKNVYTYLKYYLEFKGSSSKSNVLFKIKNFMHSKLPVNDPVRNFIEINYYKPKSIKDSKTNKNKVKNIKELIRKYPGYYKFFIIKKSDYDENLNQGLNVKHDILEYDEEHYVHTMIHLFPWCIDALKYGHTIELDSTFRSLHPYVVSVPILIVNNTTIPLAIVVRTTEDYDIYKLFFTALQCVLEENKKDFDFSKMCILTDGALSFKTLCNDLKIRRFQCIRHVGESYGSNTKIGKLVVDLMLSRTKLSFYNLLKARKSIIDDYLFKASLIKKQEFNQMFRYYYNINVSNPEEIIFKEALWERIIFSCPTCTNHAERFHSTLNSKTEKYQINIKCLDIIFEEIQKEFSNYRVNHTRNFSKNVVELFNMGKIHDECDKSECDHGKYILNIEGVELKGEIKSNKQLQCIINKHLENIKHLKIENQINTSLHVVIVDWALKFNKKRGRKPQK